MTEVLQILRNLADKGVEYCVSVPDAYGYRTYSMTPEDVEVFVYDPTAIYAKAHGITKSEYFAWSDDNCVAFCAATTRSGKRCRNAVKGGWRVSARSWLELQGGYCVVHGEGGAPITCK